jgi:hypothetical protein
MVIAARTTARNGNPRPQCPRLHHSPPRLDKLGMVMDFMHLKRVVGGWIDQISTTLPLHRDDPPFPSRQASAPRSGGAADGTPCQAHPRLAVAQIPGSSRCSLGDGHLLRDLRSPTVRQLFADFSPFHA